MVSGDLGENCICFISLSLSKSLQKIFQFFPSPKREGKKRKQIAAARNRTEISAATREYPAVEIRKLVIDRLLIDMGYIAGWFVSWVGNSVPSHMKKSKRRFSACARKGAMDEGEKRKKFSAD